MVMLPGVALLASEGIALAQTPSAAASGLSAHKVLKFTSKYGNSRSAYKIPKTSAKQEKYLNFMSALLNLSPAQKEQAAGIYANALSSRTTMRTSVKTAHQGLGTAVQNNDTNGIHKAGYRRSHQRGLLPDSDGGSAGAADPVPDQNEEDYRHRLESNLRRWFRRRQSGLRR
jgi:hypothetical protein